MLDFFLSWTRFLSQGYTTRTWFIMFNVVFDDLKWVKLFIKFVETLKTFVIQK